MSTRIEESDSCYRRQKGTASSCVRSSADDVQRSRQKLLALSADDELHEFALINCSGFFVHTNSSSSSGGGGGGHTTTLLSSSNNNNNRSPRQEQLSIVIPDDGTDADVAVSNNWKSWLSPWSHSLSESTTEYFRRLHAPKQTPPNTSRKKPSTTAAAAQEAGAKGGQKGGVTVGGQKSLGLHGSRQQFDVNDQAPPDQTTSKNKLDKFRYYDDTRDYIRHYRRQRHQLCSTPEPVSNYCNVTSRPPFALPQVLIDSPTSRSILCVAATNSSNTSTVRPNKLSGSSVSLPQLKTSPRLSNGERPRCGVGKNCNNGRRRARQDRHLHPRHVMSDVRTIDVIDFVNRAEEQQVWFDKRGTAYVSLGARLPPVAIIEPAK